MRVDLASDVGVDGGAYYVYDYWNREFLGAVRGGFEADLRACASRIYAVHIGKG